MDTFDTTKEKLYFNLLMSSIYDAHFPLKRLKKVFLGLTKTPIMKLPNVTSYITCFGQPVLMLAGVSSDHSGIKLQHYLELLKKTTFST